jgi:hypothetical protein
MSRSGLNGPYQLTYDTIAATVPVFLSGVFALGYTDEHGRFCVSYVGHSLDDVRQALFDRIGTAPVFKVSTDADKRAVFDAACRLFHDFRPVGNVAHPERQRGTEWLCRHCASPQR